MVELRRLFNETVDLFDKATNPLVARDRRAGFGRKVEQPGLRPDLVLRRLRLELDVILQPHPLDHLELRFERVDMLLLIVEDVGEQVAADVIAGPSRNARSRR